MSSAIDRNTNRNLKIALGLAASAGVIGLGTIGYRYLQREQDQSAQVFQPSFSAERLLENIPISTNEEVEKAAVKIVANFSATRRLYGDLYFARDFSDKDTKAWLDKLYDDTKQNVLTGAVFLQKATYMRDVFTVDANTISIYSKKYNLNDPLELNISSALVETVTRNIFSDSAFRYDRELPRDTYDQIENLRSNVVFVGDKAVPFEPASLAFMSRTISALEGSGQNVPSRVHMFSRPRSIVPESGVLYSNGSSDLAYAIGNFYIRENPELYSEFNDDKVGKRRYIESDADDFSQFFSDYVRRGESLRKKMLFYQTFDAESYQVLRSRYDVLKNGLGVEFSANGGVKRAVEYNVGNYVMVDDYIEQDNPKRWGIYLRPEPRLDIDPDWPSTVDKERLKIFGGPEVVMNFSQQEAVRMWLVEEVASGDGGWMSEEYFGEIIDPRRIAIRG